MCGAPPFNVLVHGLLDDVFHDVRGSVVDAPGFAHFRLFFDLCLMPSRKADDFAQKPLVDGPQDFNGHNAKVVG